jgi:hypothetical protein
MNDFVAAGNLTVYATNYIYLVVYLSSGVLDLILMLYTKLIFPKPDIEKQTVVCGRTFCAKLRNIHTYNILRRVATKIFGKDI